MRHLSDLSALTDPHNLHHASDSIRPICEASHRSIYSHGSTNTSTINRSMNWGSSTICPTKRTISTIHFLFSALTPVDRSSTDNETEASQSRFFTSSVRSVKPKTPCPLARTSSRRLLRDPPSSTSGRRPFSWATNALTRLRSHSDSTSPLLRRRGRGTQQNTAVYSSRSVG